MKDRTGRTIEKGQVVDIFISDIVSAVVIAVSDGGLVGPNGPAPATLLLQVALPMKLRPGDPAQVYIVRESDRPKLDEKVM